MDLWKTLRKPKRTRKTRKKSLWKEKERGGKTREVVHRGKSSLFYPQSVPCLSTPFCGLAGAEFLLNYFYIIAQAFGSIYFIFDLIISI